MGDVLLGQQEALRLQVGHHHVVALGIELAVVPFVGHDALAIHRHGGSNMSQARLVVLLADGEVLGAKAGSGVDAAGAGVQGDVLSVEDHAFPIKQGVLGGHQLEFGPF